MDEIANKFLHIFIRLVRKEMTDYEENEKQKYELYHQITNNMKYNNVNGTNYANETGR